MDGFRNGDGGETAKRKCLSSNVSYRFGKCERTRIQASVKGTLSKGGYRRWYFRHVCQATLGKGMGTYRYYSVGNHAVFATCDNGICGAFDETVVLAIIYLIAAVHLDGLEA